MAYNVNHSSGGVARIIELPFHALGGQPAFTPAGLNRFLAEPRVAVLAYVRRDGRPNQSPIWYCYDGTTLVMSTVTGSPKHRALERDPRVTVTVQDERPPYRAAVIEGTVTLTTIEPGADPTTGMDVRYFGRLAAAEYRKLTRELYEASGLTAIHLLPTAVRGFDNTHAISKATLAFIRVRDRLAIPRQWL
jgi:PPOX class probable F420-dependent enzyme